jgi:hypothetical protein
LDDADTSKELRWRWGPRMAASADRTAPVTHALVNEREIVAFEAETAFDFEN